MIDKAWVRFLLGDFLYKISLNFEVIILLLKYIQVGVSPGFCETKFHGNRATTQLTLFGRLGSVSFFCRNGRNYLKM